MIQYELPLISPPVEGGVYMPPLPLLTPQGYNIVLRLDYEETFPHLMPVSEVLIDFYDVDDMVWDMLAVYICIVASPRGSELQRWEFCCKVADDYLEGETHIRYGDVKAVFDAGVASVYPLMRLVLDQLAQRNHILNEIIPSVTMHERRVDFYLICNCQPSVNHAMS